jgi:hypothetical protein
MGCALLRGSGRTRMAPCVAPFHPQTTRRCELGALCAPSFPSAVGARGAGGCARRIMVSCSLRINHKRRCQVWEPGDPRTRRREKTGPVVEERRATGFPAATAQARTCARPVCWRGPSDGLPWRGRQSSASSPRDGGRPQAIRHPWDAWAARHGVHGPPPRWEGADTLAVDGRAHDSPEGDPHARGREGYLREKGGVVWHALPPVWLK